MFVLTNTAGASATTPPASKTTLFVDASGVPSTKSSGGTVTPLLTGPAAAAAYQPLDADLTGIAGLTYAADKSIYYTGSAWATYDLTGVGRTLLAATTQAAQRTAIQAVGLSGDENIAGIKTFTANNAIRSLATGAGFWIESLSATYGFMVNTDGTRMNINLRSPNFGAQVMTAYQFTDSGIRTGVPFTPFNANTQTVGSSALPFNQFFAQNTTISTSDARLKTEPRQLREAESKAASAIARLPAVWRWLSRVNGDENCEPEGMAARKHFGPTVQATIAVMQANGLDPFAYSFICYDEWQAEEATYDDEGNELTPAREAGNRYSFRKEELLCFIVRALAQEIDGLADRVAALEAKA